MEVILIQGKENTGKTTLCKKIEDCLIDSGFRELVRESRPTCGYEQDFTAIYRKDKCTVIINSESEKGGLDRFIEIYENNLPYDECTIIITAIRPKDSNPNLNKWTKDVYKKYFLDDRRVKKNEYVIDLNIEREKFDELDFCEFIETVLNNEGKRLLGEIKKKLNCQIEINMPIK